MSEHKEDSLEGGSEITFRRYDAGDARQLRDAVEAVYVRSYVEAIASGDPFDSVEAFMNRFDSYAANPDFDLIVAYAGGEAIGQAWGWPLGERTKWWEGLLTEPPDQNFTRETGHRTFALSEIMVSQECTGRGVAHALHDRLLSKRPESRATLLVEPENLGAYRAYLRWGWRKVGELRPGWDDAPIWDVLILELDVNATRV